ncbi:MAG: asparagine synthase (glutamine-hydrolyzing) [Actinomycetota bacterium]|nr:asparagine synthase (glutamine-hydrolyzing) [Actinomycetota bacterium]
MCGISGIAGPGLEQGRIDAMVAALAHRGPDDTGTYLDPSGAAGFGHNRLSIIDLSPAGHGPMPSADRSVWINFNGEVYNYVELRAELSDYPYTSRTDTEVVLAAYLRWGEACLDRLVGMFAFAIWDERSRTLFAARDRFGVKPFHYAVEPDGTLLYASEIKALHAAGVPARPDQASWATYLTFGLSDHGERTFWDGVRSLPPGHALRWKDGRLTVWRWYDLAERSGLEIDRRDEHVVADEYLELLRESVRLRFRSDVPVGINLSGGVDSSTLLGLVQQVQGADSDVAAFTFVTGDDRYDELPWVERMLERTRHPSVVCRLDPGAVPELARSVMVAEDEPFGGMPTIAYALLFEEARARGVTVLLDGQGLDEQWAGYEYYGQLSDGPGASGQDGSGRRDGHATGPVQAGGDRALRPGCATEEFQALARSVEPPTPFPDAMRNRQYLDATIAKIPRALRFNDRVSMRVSRELREPFLDHRLFELAMRQPADRKVRNGTHKALLRDIAARLVPAGVAEAPKRPVQTPQREWLRGPLRDWAGQFIDVALAAYGGAWLDADGVREAWRAYAAGEERSSFHVWQWVSLGLWHDAVLVPRARQAVPS